MAPNTTVFFRPTKSEMIPVGSSNIAEDNCAIAKILIPSAKEPETFEKYKMATGAYSLKSVKKLNQARIRIFL